jgi:hypothetical protein
MLIGWLNQGTNDSCDKQADVSDRGDKRSVAAVGLASDWLMWRRVETLKHAIRYLRHQHPRN